MSRTKSDENHGLDLLYLWIPLYLLVTLVSLVIPSTQIYAKFKNGYTTMLPMVPATPVFLTAVVAVSVLSFMEYYTPAHLIFDCILAWNIETTWLSETGILCCIICHWRHGASPATTVVVHSLLAPILHRKSVLEEENVNTNDGSYGAINGTVVATGGFIPVRYSYRFWFPDSQTPTTNAGSSIVLQTPE